MSASVALREPNVVDPISVAPTRDEVLTRYRRFRAISKQHHSNLVKFVAAPAIMRHARRLGLAQGNTLLVDNIDDLHLAFDLAIHTAESGRSRAIDRYAKSVQLVPRSDDAVMLEAMCRARFSVVLVERRHEAAGLIVRDMFRNEELWVVDEGWEISMPKGSVIATRLYAPDRFVMTAGIGVPIDLPLLEDALDEAPQLLRKSPHEFPDDRRFAEAIYRVALRDGIMEQVKLQDVPTEAD